MKVVNVVNIMGLMVAAFVVGYVCGFHDTGVVPSLGDKIVDSDYQLLQMRVTAYCPCSICCGNSSDGITANGHVIQSGDRFVAAPRDIPFGTVIEIPGYGKVPVWDRGGAIKGNRLDVFFPTHQEALVWGVKLLDVKVWPKQ